MPDDRRLVKLVRDDVEKFCGGDTVVRYERMSDAEFVEALRKKLIEEATEYLLDPSVGELADVAEVVEALMRHDQGIEPSVLREEMKRKRDHKGGFDEKLGMYLHVAPEHRTAA